MNIRPYKFLVMPVVQELDDDGNVLQEMSPEQPIAVFGIEGLHRFADSYEADLMARISAQNGNKGG
jgi:hypothetical protein